MNSPPVDLSFKNLSHIAASMSTKPRNGLRPIRTNSEMKYMSCSLRLSYNSIQDFSGLHCMLNYFLAEPTKLGWLDLSFNKITSIDTALCELRELRVLYLHSNSIWSLSEVDKLGELQFLHTITLHGNTIDSIKGYRQHVVSALPMLKKMDFSAVTREERVLANIWSPCTNQGKIAVWPL
uniref:Leucine-rich repeat-containing protein 51 n=1 Tax=Labrus bergylta TaxID=56723 RepID=A0A3Q3LJE8_9LABR|nr:leucine-rich repeat-containing protein 51-like isoform X1 [Labrus bergylta]XP_029134940.1 leucine-rich repeat-containing protein 51-like isoform X1 [Labrus bergylta]